MTGTATLGCNGGATRCTSGGSACVDLVGCGGADRFEGAAPRRRLTNSTSAQRASSAAARTPTTTPPTSRPRPTAPRNSAGAAQSCDADQAPFVSANIARVRRLRRRARRQRGHHVQRGCVNDRRLVLDHLLDHRRARGGGHGRPPDVRARSGRRLRSERELHGVACSRRTWRTPTQDDPPDQMAAGSLRGRSRSLAAEPTASTRSRATAHLSPLRGRWSSRVPGVVTGRAAATASACRTRIRTPTRRPPRASSSSRRRSRRWPRATPVTVAGLVDRVPPGRREHRQPRPTTELERATVYTGRCRRDDRAAPWSARAGGVPPKRVIDDDALGTSRSSGIFDPRRTGSTSTRASRGCCSQVERRGRRRPDERLR